MIKETKIVEVFCDYCGAPCKQDNRNLKVYLGGDNNCSNYINARVSFYNSCAVSDGDVCNKCAAATLKNLIKELEKE
jgi:hypothetical protein